jgi:hypothetical protein
VITPTICAAPRKICTGRLQDGFRIHDDVLVFAAHLHVEGALLSKSERPMDVADTYSSHAAAIPLVS